MKMSDILRQVANQMDQTGHKDHDDHREENNYGVPMEKETPVTMIPPLQQKLEILKKAAGEPNAFDDGVGHSGERADSEDELNRIKRIAGLTVMIDGPQGEMG